MLKRVLVATVIATACLAEPSLANATQDRIVEQLKEQGFTRIEIRRTLLGRTRVLATSREFRREIVFNPATGVILRDFWVQLNGTSNPGTRIVNPDGSSESSSNSGSGDSGDDDDDDDEYDDDGDNDDGDDDDDGDSSDSDSDDSGDDGEDD